MSPTDLRAIRERVQSVAERIQPLLKPVEGLRRRNARAHIWLGVKLLFGEEWRVRADPASVLRFIDWVGTNPNAEYDAWPGSPGLRDGSFSERLF